MDIEKKTMEIINLIKNTEEFKNAKDIRSRILKDANLTAMIKNFQSRQAELYRRNLPPQQMELEMKKIADNFERMSSNTIIKDYAQAVQQVQGIIYNSNMTILESIDEELNI
ncbi:hypothetical protein SH1V18_19920 [Vallitalea longa]|uniref:YlbF family regulator n=1 Tax=Vallitalea longa TaxID=2936439 RepID=A0A9W5Y935_9FIRM|nr:YlbF family regulator [Vallitalea longa]GKX29512.1 hypothetical protein SH1V18_19920 [Vallitalea longa]